MADIPVSFFEARKVRTGTSVSSPPTLEGETNPPVNPPSSNPIFEAGIGIKLNGQVIGGVKRYLMPFDVLDIPEFWQYNIHGLTLDIDGIIQNNGGEINVG